MTYSEETNKKGKDYKKKSTKSKLSPEEQFDYDELYRRVCEVYNIDKPEPIMFRQMKTLKEQKGISYAEQDYILWYMKYVANTFNPQYKLGQIEFHYQDAKHFALEQAEREERVRAMSDQMKDRKCNIIHATYKAHVSNDKNILIDIDQFLEGGEEK